MNFCASQCVVWSLAFCYGPWLWGHGLLRVSVKVSEAMKRHHDHGNSEERKHLVGAGLQFRG